METDLYADYLNFRIEDAVTLELADGSTLRLDSDDVLALIAGKLGAPLDS